LEVYLNFKQIIGLLAIILGVALLIFVFYGKNKIEAGKEEIASGKKKVAKTQQMFSFTPITKQVGQGLTSGGEAQIAAGELTIEQYEKIFMWCEIGGIALIVVGAGLILFCRNKKHK
jgi:hypothetical protein